MAKIAKGDKNAWKATNKREERNDNKRESNGEKSKGGVRQVTTVRSPKSGVKSKYMRVYRKVD